MDRLRPKQVRGQWIYSDSAWKEPVPVRADCRSIESAGRPCDKAHTGGSLPPANASGDAARRTYGLAFIQDKTTESLARGSRGPATVKEWIGWPPSAFLPGLLARDESWSIAGAVGGKEDSLTELMRAVIRYAQFSHAD